MAVYENSVSECCRGVRVRTAVRNGVSAAVRPGRNMLLQQEIGQLPYCAVMVQC